MGVFLSSVDQVLADRLQPLVDLVRLDTPRPQRFPEREDHRAQDAALKEAVALAAVAAGQVRAVVDQVVVERRGVEQGLQGGVEVTGVADVEHSGSSRTWLPVAHHDTRRLKECDLKRKRKKINISFVRIGF